MLTERCSFKICKVLKERGFPQYSLEFCSDYYDESGRLVYNVEDNTDGLIFAPYICEVIDRFELDLNLYLSVYYNTNGFQYRIYDPSESKEILSNIKNIELSSVVYEKCILKAIEYYDKKKRKGVKGTA